MKEQNISLLLKCGIFSTLLMVALGLTACSTIVATHGQVVDERYVRQLQPGITTQEQVRQLLGSPSTTGTFNANRWYYLTETTENTPLNPNVLQKRQLVIVEFSDSGVVSGLFTKTEKDGKEVPYFSDETPTQGQSMGIMDQMLDNLGKGF